MKPLEVLVFLAITTASTNVVVADPDASPGSFCGADGHRTALVDNRLFWASGNYTFVDGKMWHSTTDFYWLDLTKSFAVDGAIATDVLNTSILPSTDLSSGWRIEDGGSSGTFFVDHTMLYAYGAIIGDDANGVNNSLWAYNTTEDTWGLAPIDNGTISFGDNSEGSYTSDPATGKSWYTGGWEIGFDGSGPGMVHFNSTNSDDLSFEFVSSTTDLKVVNTLKGTMVYTRKGKQGTLIAFGGDDTTTGGVYNGAHYWDQFNMDQIFIYDIDSSTWYNITASGDIPTPRTEFCAGVSAAPDDSSFQITIHGGWDQGNTVSRADVWVLSIPSFVWIKVNATDDPDLTSDPNSGRHRHKCHVYEDAQMLVLGGVVESNATARNDYCNSTDHPPVKVLDTSTYAWQTEFQPNKSYTVPDIVTNVIGGNSSGNATLLHPLGGFNSTILSTIFTHTVPRDNYTSPAHVSPTTSTTPTSTPSPSSSSSSNAGAIAGGIVGGIAGLALIAAALILYRRRSVRKKKAAAAAAAAGDDDATAELSPYSARHEVESSPASPRDGVLGPEPPRYELSDANKVYEMGGVSAGEREGEKGGLRGEGEVVHEMAADGEHEVYGTGREGRSWLDGGEGKK
ncbi:hypothetical protein K490DRAFT_52570 [Saccharata proteae CBS 121410]|uniref:Galactose oxidase n=1 Tax=Saccharata proteae CBS 121410 TaxID=1314787 RepID=A0A9P4LZQ1_9PEZI|nr:hypothetical protein K490DRAFT_52570 [Saccharata proteae CBS 121410]